MISKNNSLKGDIIKFIAPFVLIFGLLFFTQNLSVAWEFICNLIEVTIFQLQLIIQMIVKIPDIRQQVIQNIIQTIIVWGIFAFTYCKVSKKKVTAIVGGIISVIFTVIFWI